MKKYSDIPLKERKRNAERCYRHEEKLEERAFERLIKEAVKEKQCNSEYKTDKDREADEVYERLKAMEKGGAE